MKSMFKFDAKKFAERAEEEKKALEDRKSKGKEKDITKDPILKVHSGGTYGFRAVPYIHNPDFESNPFPVRAYHQGIPGTRTFYCPKNHGEKCEVCEFVWERIMENKKNGGDKETFNKWKRFLPNKKVIIPGILTGERSEEGLKYFLLTTLDDKMSKWHQRIWEWLSGKSTYYFLDPVNGFDMILKYETYDKAKSAAMGGATHGFESIDLERESTPISEDPEATWKMIEETMLDIDKSLPGFEKRTHEDSIKVLNEWLETEKKWASKKTKPPVDSSKDSDGSIVESEKIVTEDNKPYTPPSSESAVSASDARKQRMSAMLKR